MTRTQFKPARRRAGGAWQWTIIGLVIGFGCGIVMLLVGLTLGFLEPNFTGVASADLPTQTPIVVTATIDGNATEAPTQTPFIITTTPDVAAIATLPSDVLFPTDTLAPAATSTPNGEATAPAAAPTEQSAGINSLNTAGTGGVPSMLAGIGSQLMPVEGGTFTMGTTPAEVAEAVRQCIEQGGSCITSHADDSMPAHQVSVNNFMIERTEVSYTQYIAFLNYLKSQGKDHRNGCGTDSVPQRCTDIQAENANTYISSDPANYFLLQESIVGNTPAVYVTWYGADAYCRAIGRRLPTEAEWERAARGPSNMLYPWGNTWSPDNSNTVGSTNASSVPLSVESFDLVGNSGFNVLNMAGNAAEWVQDWYSPTYYAQSDVNRANPSGPLTGVERVMRGGSYAFRPFFARSVHRLSASPDNRTAYSGFRCAADDSSSGGIDTNSVTPLSNPGSTSLDVPAFQPPAGTLDPANLGSIGSATTGAQPTLAATPAP